MSFTVAGWLLAKNSHQWCQESTGWHRPERCPCLHKISGPSQTIRQWRNQRTTCPNLVHTLWTQTEFQVLCTICSSASRWQQTHLVPPWCEHGLDESKTLERPMSASFRWPSDVNKTFWGLMSCRIRSLTFADTRCIMPTACKARTASRRDFAI